jgi:hypothetical protein
MTEYARRVLLDQPIELASGREWYSDPFSLSQGDVVTVSATADENFYAGFFSREEFHRRYGRRGESFDFEYGTDSAAYTTRVVVPEDDDYYFVVRVGVFSGTATINARIVAQHPIDRGTVHGG